jgi:uncharacterized protein YggE
MKKLILGILLSIPIVVFAQTGGKNFIDQNYIEVTGKAELEVSPDMIYLKIVLSDKNNKDKLPLPEIEKRMISRLTDIGVDVNKDLSVMDFTSNLKAYLLKSDVVSLTKQYQLIIHDSKTLQKVYFVFQELGISDVSITKLDHSQIAQFRKDVKISAIKAAKEKAEMIADALNQKIGKAIYIQEADNPNFNLYGNLYSNTIQSISSNSQDDSDNDIDFAKIKITSTFLVRFALE